MAAEIGNIHLPDYLPKTGSVRTREFRRAGFG
jgi:hypothetical protein